VIVRCARHNGDVGQLAYAVCVHVLEHDAAIRHYIEAAPDCIGEALCAVCRLDVESALLRLICARCLETLLETTTSEGP
jgi:hypothetical protein